MCFLFFLLMYLSSVNIVTYHVNSSGSRTVSPVCSLLAGDPGDGGVEFIAFYGEGQYYNPHLLAGETEAQKGSRMTCSSGCSRYICVSCASIPHTAVCCLPRRRSPVLHITLLLDFAETLEYAFLSIWAKALGIFSRNCEEEQVL